MPAHEGGNALVETDYLVAANANVPDLWRQWLDGVAPTSADVNPLFCSASQIAGLNPQLIFVGAGEFALQEGKDWQKLCKEAQVHNHLKCEPEQMHIFSLGSDWLSASVRDRTDATIFQWIGRHLPSRKMLSK
jgi:acetyl esterase/lipase